MKRDALPAADQAFHLLDEAVDCSSADETEAVLIAGAAGLTRFADSRIHQNVVGENVELLLRVAVGGRVAGFRTNRLSGGGGKTAVERAAEIARQTPADPDFPGLPHPAGGVWVGDRAVRATAEATPRGRAARVRLFVDACGGASAAGAPGTGGVAAAGAHLRGPRGH